MSDSQSRVHGDSVCTVLMTGAGAPGASGVIRSLRMVEDRTVRIVGVDMNPDAYGFDLVDNHYVVPGGGEPDYIPRMQAVARREDVDVIMPLTTAELAPLAANRDAFDGCVMVSCPEALSVANDKAALYEYLATRGFDSAPAYRQVGSEQGFLDAVEALGYPDSPVCFKPPVSSGMRGFRVLDPTVDQLELLLDRKPDAAVTTLDAVLPVLTSGGSFPELAVMEYLPGQEYSVDVLATGEETGPIVPRSRARTRAGISFEGTVEKRQDLIDEAAAISRSLGLEYNVNFQFRYDADGVPKIIEINPRISGTIVMCVGAGANMPALALKYALGEQLPGVDIDWGTEMVRFWQEVFRTSDGEGFLLAPAQSISQP